MSWENFVRPLKIQTLGPTSHSYESLLGSPVMLMKSRRSKKLLLYCSRIRRQYK